MNGISRVLLAAWLVSASAARGEEIPVEIRWAGAPPDSISQIVPGGIADLVGDSGARVFRGSITVTGDRPQRRSFVIRYDGFTHPIDVRVHRVSPPIRFVIRYQPSASCTDGRVTAFSQNPNSLPDAIDRSIGAGQLLSIGRPNACDDDLRFRAVSARYRQSARMSALSQGLFMVNPTIAEEYRLMAQARGLSVASEMGAYAVEEAGLEATQLLAARKWAKENGEVVRAGAIHDFMLRRIDGSEGIREIFRQQGVTRPILVRQAGYFDTRAGS